MVNDADSGKKLSPETETQNPKPGTGGSPSLAFNTEVSEICKALKARPLVRLTAGFDPVIRQMLASGETVEIIKRAILRGCWLKLARRDRGDTSLIFSMCYFLNVIADVKPMADPAYWRNFERRLGREELERGLLPSIKTCEQRSQTDGRVTSRAEMSAPTVAAIQHQMSAQAAQKAL